MFQMAKCKIYQHISFQGAPSCAQIGTFGMNIYHLATMARGQILLKIGPMLKNVISFTWTTNVLPACAEPKRPLNAFNLEKISQYFTIIFDANFLQYLTVFNSI
jgi:hypothetical protein